MNKQCPVCPGNQQMRMSQMKCIVCNTTLTLGETEPLPKECIFCSMSSSDKYFILEFLKTEGTIVKMQKIFGLSYPTVKNRLKTITKQLEGGLIEKDTD